jgi:hypothetical protein
LEQRRLALLRSRNSLLQQHQSELTDILRLELLLRVLPMVGKRLMALKEDMEQQQGAMGLQQEGMVHLRLLSQLQDLWIVSHVMQ